MNPLEIPVGIRQKSSKQFRKDRDTYIEYNYVKNSSKICGGIPR